MVYNSINVGFFICVMAIPVQFSYRELHVHMQFHALATHSVALGETALASHGACLKCRLS